MVGVNNICMLPKLKLPANAARLSASINTKSVNIEQQTHNTEVSNNDHYNHYSLHYIAYTCTPNTCIHNFVLKHHYTHHLYQFTCDKFLLSRHRNFKPCHSSFRYVSSSIR